MKIVKRADMPGHSAMFLRIGFILLALLCASLFLMVMHLNPLSVYGAMIKGSLGSLYRLKETVKFAVPLIILSIGIMIAFKMKFWNIGAEGQMFMGAFGASYFALFWGNLPGYILLPLMALGGIVCGGLWALLAGFFKVKWGTNETLLTLMLNYVARLWIMYLQFSIWRDPGSLGFPKIVSFGENAILPTVFGLHAGWIIAALLSVIMFVFMRKSKMGYEISVIGDSPGTAAYAGMKVARTTLLALFISGGLCGLAGMIQCSAVNQTLDIEITAGAGYTAIITAWLSNLNEAAVIFVSILFAMLVQGANYIQIVFQIPQSAAQILQGIILFFVLGGEFFIHYKISPTKG